MTFPMFIVLHACVCVCVRGKGVNCIKLATEIVTQPEMVTASVGMATRQFLILVERTLHLRRSGRL